MEWFVDRFPVVWKCHNPFYGLYDNFRDKIVNGKILNLRVNLRVLPENDQNQIPLFGTKLTSSVEMKKQ